MSLNDSLRNLQPLWNNRQQRPGHAAPVIFRQPDDMLALFPGRSMLQAPSRPFLLGMASMQAQQNSEILVQCYRGAGLHDLLKETAVPEKIGLFAAFAEIEKLLSSNHLVFLGARTLCVQESPDKNWRMIGDAWSIDRDWFKLDTAGLPPVGRKFWPSYHMRQDWSAHQRLALRREMEEYPLFEALQLWLEGRFIGQMEICWQRGPYGLLVWLDAGTPDPWFCPLLVMPVS